MTAPTDNSPPKGPLKFLRWFCNDELIEDVEGDLSELYFQRKKQKPKLAKWLFLKDVILLIRPDIIKKSSIENRLINNSMLKIYFKIFFRNALRNKSYSALNLLGLIVGIVSSVLILLWVNSEVQVDKFHSKGDNIYQLFRNMRQSSGSVITTSSLPKPLSDLVKAEYSEVSQVALYSWPMEVLLTKEDQAIMDKGRFVNPDFLEMFSFPLLAGNNQTALGELNSIMISQSLAEKHFGSGWRKQILGQTLRLDNERDVVVTGVFKDTDDKSSLKFDWLMPAQYLINENSWVDNWGNGSFSAFVTISSDESVEIVRDRILNEIITHAAGNDNAGEEQVVLQKFQDTYLHSNFDNGVVSGGRIDYVNIMLVVAIFILIIACINFVNLVTAQSGRRSKEIGLRKVMGAGKKSISGQFFVESLIMSALAVFLAIGFLYILLPYFNAIVDKSLYLDFSLISTWYYMFSLIFIIGILSGIYPAVLLPTFSIIKSLKGNINPATGTNYFRKGLVIFQFGISILLIIGTAVVNQQMGYILNKDIGLKKENLLIVRMQGDLNRNFQPYKSALLEIPQIESVSVASGNPIDYGRSTSSAKWEGKDPTKSYEINVMVVDESFIATMGMSMSLGRDFSVDYSDSSNFIINEVAAEMMGFNDPLNKDLSLWKTKGKIIGVVKNFHMKDMHQSIAPLVIACFKTNESQALIRLNGHNVNEALTSIEQLTKEVNPLYDFDYQFVDQAYMESYKSEETVSTLTSIFAFISIFISCLGLLGLSAYSAEQRSKEIGVRKVHGASVLQIILLLTKDYSKLMILGFLIALPFAFYYTQNWLDNFEFRTQLSPTLFLVAGAITFIIGLLTVSFKSYQAAKANPTNTLRSE